MLVYDAPSSLFPVPNMPFGRSKRSSLPIVRVSFFLRFRSFFSFFFTIRECFFLLHEDLFIGVHETSTVLLKQVQVSECKQVPIGCIRTASLPSFLLNMLTTHHTMCNRRRVHTQKQSYRGSGYKREKQAKARVCPTYSDLCTNAE